MFCSKKKSIQRFEDLQLEKPRSKESQPKKHRTKKHTSEEPKLENPCINGALGQCNVLQQLAVNEMLEI